MSKIVFTQGNEAFVLGAIDAGARFYAGYPITPSTEIAEISSVQLPRHDGVYIQMEDEISSMGAIVGASLSGMKSFTATSGPGFSLMQENLGVAIMAEVPCVIVNIQRSGPSTGMATKPAQGDVMQAKWGTHGDHGIIALSPSSVQECYELMIDAFNLSEKYRVPVVILGDEIIGHMKEKLVMKDRDDITIVNRKQPTCHPDDYRPYDYSNGIAPLATYGGNHLLRVSSSMHDDTGYPNNNPEMASRYIKYLTDKIENNKHDIVMTKQFLLDDAEIVIVSYGCSARSALAAMEAGRDKNIKIGVLQLLTIWPFAEEQVSQVLKTSKMVVVPELNLGQVIGEVKKLNDYGTRVIGVNRVDGKNIHPNEILNAIMEDTYDRIR
jgi:2-oxoglutarate ferredoxin oxidoreductase subunit alpha